MPNEQMGRRDRPESADVATRTVIVAVSGFLAFTAIALALLFLYLKVSVPGALSPVRKASFPQPALQEHPREDLRRHEQRQRARLGGYGWVDRSKGLVRLPIEEAMRVIAARGAHAYDPLDPPGQAEGTVGSDGGKP